MNSSERIKSIFDGRPDRAGFWLGNPADETKSIYYDYFGIRQVADSHNEAPFTGEEDLKMAMKVKSDLIWYSPELDSDTWRHPEGKPMFDVLGGEERKSLNQPGVFADCESVSEIEKFDWPNLKYLNFESTLNNVTGAKENNIAVAGGMWMSFFHVMCDFFGMEEYFIKMYTDPAVVEAATEYVIDFYLEANKRCLDIMGDKIDIVFFGNDFGAQKDLLISEECFEKFVLPYEKRIIDQAKAYGKKVMLHSCGSIHRVIPKLIDAGIDALHPIQANAVGMDAVTLSQKYKNDLVFVGGVDTQHLLPNGTPEMIKNEVYRLKELFGDNYIVSPSHEAVLPDVSIENFIALCEAAAEFK